MEQGNSTTPWIEKKEADGGTEYVWLEVMAAIIDLKWCVWHLYYRRCGDAS